MKNISLKYFLAATTIFFLFNSKGLIAQDYKGWEDVKPLRNNHNKNVREHISAMHDEYKSRNKLDLKKLNSHAAAIREETEKIKNYTSEMQSRFNSKEKTTGKTLRKIVYAYNEILVNEMKIETELKTKQPNINQLDKLGLRINLILDKTEILWRKLEAKITYDIKH